MDENKLYTALNKSGFYTKSQDEFEQQFSTPESQEKLYNTLNSANYYTKSFDDFSNQFFVKKKDDSGQTSGLGSEALSTYTKEDFLKQQLDLQETAFSTAINKPIQDKAIPEQKPMSMETFQDVMVDVKKGEEKQKADEENQKLFKEFEDARNKLKESAKQDELRAKERAVDKGIYGQTPIEPIVSGKMDVADFSPDGNYFYGYLKNVNESTVSFFRKIDGADKFMAHAISKASGGILPESSGLMGQVADWMEKKVVKGLPDTPDNVAGQVLGMIGQMNSFPVDLAMTPQAKIKALSTITGGAINEIPKLALTLGIGSGLEEYSRTGDVKSTAVKASQGFTDGLFLHMLGGLSGVAGESISKNPLTQQLSAVGINALGFGGKAAVEEYEATGKVTAKNVVPQMTFAAVLAAPDIAQMANTYFTSTKNTIRSVANIKVDYKKLTAEYKNLIKEERTEGITPERRTEIEIAKDGIQGLMSMNFAIDDVRKNPDKYKEIVNRDETINEQEKKFQLDKIDYIQKNVKEIKPKQVKEGISEPIEPIITEKATETIPEQKQAVTEPKIDTKPQEETKPIVKDEIKPYTTKDEFKKDFLDESVVESNLKDTYIPTGNGQTMKASEKLAAAKNLREGKMTKQAEFLQEYLDKSFKDGNLELVYPDKKTKIQAGINDIVKPKPTEQDILAEYDLKAPKKEKYVPDEYQTLAAKDESGQQEISMKLGIDKENHIDVTKSNAKKEANKLVKEKAKKIDKQNIKLAKQDIKYSTIARRKALGLETFETNLFTHDLQSRFDKDQREAMTFLLEKQGVPDGLVGDKVKRYHDNPTPEMKQAVKEVRERYDKAWDYMVNNTDKMSADQIKDYVTHIWKIPDKKITDVVSWFTTKNRFTKKRSIESIKEGMEKFGLEPQTLDISEILRVYESARINAVENQKYVDAIKGLDMDGVKLLLKQNEAPADWKEIDHPALTYKTYIPAKEIGNPATLHKSYYKVHPDIYGSLKAVLGTGTNTGEAIDKVTRAYDNISGYLKKSNLSLSLFHHQALLETAVATMGLPRTLKILSKDLIWDGSTGKGLPVFRNPEIARDAIAHLVQFGATKDIPVAKIAGSLNKLAEATKGVKGVGELMKLVAKGNEGWDRMLWDYLHDGLKLYGYEHLAGKERSRAIKEGWSNEQLDKRLDEIGQLVNDTFGGQHWDVLGVSPRTQKIMGRLLLSPDWTISTIRQALSPIGVGSLYNNDGFWKNFKSSVTKGTPINARAKAGRVFWLKAAAYTTIGINLINVMNRLKDEKEHPENPLYQQYKDKPLKDKIIPYSMYGNTIGHKTHLFSGRYADGMEMYLRWGKQFRELPEMFMDEDGITFPKPLLKKIGGKANPMLSLITQLTTGHTPSGYENWDLKDKKGWDWTVGALETVGKAGLPYSSATMFRGDKETHITDLFMPASKGMTPSKAIDLFGKGMEFSHNGFDADKAYIQEVYSGAIANNLDALSLFKIAARNKEADATNLLRDGIRNIDDAKKKLKETKNPVEREKLEKLIDKLYKQQDNIKDAKVDFFKVTDYIQSKEDEYLEIK